MSPSRKKKPKKAKKSKKTPEPAPVLETDAAIATSEKPGLKRYAVFRVGQQKYAVDVDNIIEVLHQFTVERVSHLPDVFPGVINLRGTSIPVVDLPCLLREETIASDEKTCLIAMLDKEQIGFLIDSDIEIIMSDEGRVHALPGAQPWWDGTSVSMRWRPAGSGPARAAGPGRAELVFLASDVASHMTGQVLHPHGGSIVNG